MSIKYSLLSDDSSITPKVFGNRSNSFVFEYPCENGSFCYPYEIYVPRGIYTIELWGAEGGSNFNQNYNDSLAYGGNSGYIRQKYSFSQSMNVYLYIGGKPPMNLYHNVGERGYNGGGLAQLFGGGGGGGTDIRTGKGNWNESIDSRFIVAGGGGGSRLTNTFPYKGGDAGGLEGTIGRGNKGKTSCAGSTIKEKCIGGETELHNDGTFCIVA